MEKEMNEMVPSPEVLTTNVNPTNNILFRSKTDLECAIQICYSLPGGITKVESFLPIITAFQLKQFIYEQAKTSSESSQLRMGDISAYILKLNSRPNDFPGPYVIDDESLTLQDVECLKYCCEKKIVPRLSLVKNVAGMGLHPTKYKRQLTEEKNNLKDDIVKLIGMDLSEIYDEEVLMLRNEMKFEHVQIRQERKIRQETNKIRDKLQDYFPISLIGVPATTSGNGTFFIRVTLTEKGCTTTIKVNDLETTDSVIEKAYQKFVSQKYINPNEKSCECFVLKTELYQEYLLGQTPLLYFECVSAKLKKKVEVNLQFCDITMFIESFNDSEQMNSELEYTASDEFAKATEVEVETKKISTLSHQFQISCIGIDQPTASSFENFYREISEQGTLPDSIWIEFSLCFGGKLIRGPQITKPITLSSSARWNESIYFDIEVKDLPLGCKLCSTLWGKNDNQVIAYASVNVSLADYQDNLRQGKISRKMFGGKANPFNICSENFHGLLHPKLFIEFVTYAYSVKFDSPTEKISKGEQLEIDIQYPPNESEQKQLFQSIEKHPLEKLSEEETSLFWKYRYFLIHNYKAFPKFLHSVNWSNFEDVCRTYFILGRWARLPPLEALELLSVKFADPQIRKIAVECLDALSDSQLIDLLPQLVQVLKSEPTLNSKLAIFLLRRGLRNPFQVGHSFFWLLRGEMFSLETAYRFGFLLEEFIKGLSNYYRHHLVNECELLEKLNKICENVKAIKRENREDEVKSRLKELPLPKLFHLPLGFKWCASGIDISTCKVMDSAKSPIWMTLTNVNPNEPMFSIMYKSGDDLRQDVVTLQMIRMMDKMWEMEGLELCLNTYGVVSTGSGTGLLEMVPDSVTYAQITREAGGAMEIFNKQRVKDWISKQNPGKACEIATQNFIHSTAGYCVATYILGIGDRHDSNIMFTRKGHLFHIDFGHFLGHFKNFDKIPGIVIRRERTPFVFTPDWAVAMGGLDSENFKKFVDLCCRAFLCIRRNANLFINMFTMMLSTGIPELQSEEDIQYMVDVLMLDTTELQATQKFQTLILESHNNKFKQIDGYCHIVAHENNNSSLFLS